MDMMMMMMNGGGCGNWNANGGGRDINYQQQQDLDAAFFNFFPAGYRFKPTDQELIREYLFRKVNTFQLPPNRIVDANIYLYNPWELTARYKSYGENIFYFFTPRERKYPNGKRPNRAAGVGYWKACGADTPILDEITKRRIGYKKVLVFYKGKTPQSDFKTNWIMHEYTLKKPNEEEEEEEEKKKNNSSSPITGSSRKNKRPCPDAGIPNNMQLDEFVLCKLYLKRDKSTEDMEYYPADNCEDMIQENNIAAVAAPNFPPPPPPPFIPTATSSVAAVPENYHYLQQTAGVAYYHDQHPSTSMVAAAAAAAVPAENYHYMQQTDDVVASDAYYHDQYPLTSMVSAAAAAAEEIVPFGYNNYYSDNINISSSASSSAILPSVLNQQQQQQHHHGEIMNEQQLEEYEWNKFVTEMMYNDIDSHSTLLGPADFSVPDLRTDIGRRN